MKLLMTDLDRSLVERSKTGFSIEAIHSARARTREAVNEIAARIRPGMLEDEAIKMAQELLQQKGAGKNWHRVILRFGRNTLKTFGGQSDAGVRLGEKDICFVDIGPVWDGYEGDSGDTFVVGDDADMLRCQADCRELFDRVKAEWKNAGLTGKGLYDFAATEAEKMGWVLNLGTDGHRVADFPHQLYSRNAIAELDWTPAPHIWVLEIQIRHPEREFGAFYEDLLF